ncbi:MAG TPA: hypothetical protein VMT59_13075 [Gaiellaceae bacterium]|nr:hypothetical protein [Gaiellaceae bacterium]
MTRRNEFAALPLREELEALARYYHHLRNEHKQAHAESSARRQLEARMLRVGDRFEAVLREWVPDAELQEEWRAHLHNRVREPARPAALVPLVFMGRSDAGSTVEIRGKGDELAVEVDGSLVLRLTDGKDFESPTPPVEFRLDKNSVFEEVFGASEPVLEALAEYCEDPGPPPWEHASALLADGLIDAHFAVRPRGKRAIAR